MEHDIGAILRRPYSWVLVPQEEGGFTSEILEFPGCVSQGETVVEAFGNLQAVAHAWLAACLDHGLPIPAPAAEAAPRVAPRRAVEILSEAARFIATQLRRTPEEILHCREVVQLWFTRKLATTDVADALLAERAQAYDEGFHAGMQANPFAKEH